MLHIYQPSESASESAEIQAIMPQGTVLQANEEIRQQTGELLFGVSVDNDKDLVWGNIDPENVPAIRDVIEAHGGTLRGSDDYSHSQQRAA